MSRAALGYAMAAASELPTHELDELRVRIEQWLAERKQCTPLPADWLNAPDASGDGGSDGR